jgi:hypothetical protein
VALLEAAGRERLAPDAREIAEALYDATISA